MLRDDCKALEISLLCQPQNENTKHRIDYIFLYSTVIGSTRYYSRVGRDFVLCFNRKSILDSLEWN